jgi:ribosomal protein L16 Arg81 hydroxylase
MKFEDAIAPISTESFIHDQLDRDWAIFQGEAERFSHLVPWTSLNRLLNELRIPPQSSRLKLVKGGQAIKEEDYLAKHHRWGAFLKAGMFERHMAEGATLVLDGVDEFFPAIRQLTSDTEEVLRRYAWTNLYCGWGSEQGFDLHWDDHDTVIVQISGRKRWTVYKPTCTFPHRDFPESWAKPTDEPVWAGVLNAGSVLYMPRGWWHYAQPLAEPTLHITIGLRALTGSDVLNWLAGQLLQTEVFRMNLPLVQDPGRGVEYLTSLRAEISRLLSSASIEHVKRHADSALERRSLIDLRSAREVNPRISDDTVILLSGFSALKVLESEPGRLTIRSAELNTECSSALLHALRQLSDTAGRRFDQLVADLSGSERTELRVLLATLFLAGKILLRNPGDVAIDKVHLER